MNFKSLTPGFENNRVKEKWIPYFTCSSIFCGFGSAYFALTLGYFYFIYTFCLMCSSINYWRNPKPGFRLLIDMFLIFLNMAINYYQSIFHINSCNKVAIIYIGLHWSFITLSILLYNFMPKYKIFYLDNKDWSCLFWLILHFSCLLSNYILFYQLDLKINIC